MRMFIPLTVWIVAAFPALAANSVTTFRLDNGMDLVVIEDHRAPVVVNMVWYRVGAADEPKGKSGIAHFLEHLMFKGTDDIPPGEFSKIVAANGGSDNAFTSLDYTGYFQRVAADRLDLVMGMEADRMRNLRLAEADVLTERDVVLEERNQRTESNPGALLVEQISAAQYLNHPYSIPIVGWKREIETLTRQDALDFYERFYAPNNAIAVVAGDVDPQAVLALAQKHYGPLAPFPGIGARVRPQEPPQLAERRLVYRDERVATPYLIRTYLAPERNPGDQATAAALVYLAEILGGSGLTSVMGVKLQIEEQTAIATSAWYDALSYDPSTFGLFLRPAKGVSMQDAEDAMDRVIAEFIETGVDPDQMARIKAQVRASEIYALDSLQGRARRYGEALTAGLTVADVEDWPGVLGEVTADDVIAAAKMIFDRNNAVTGWLMPAAPEDSQ